jgi:hypothetical protein
MIFQALNADKTLKIRITILIIKNKEGMFMSPSSFFYDPSTLAYVIDR